MVKTGNGQSSFDATETITRATIAEEVTRAIQATMPVIFEQVNETTRKMIEDKVMAGITKNTQKMGNDEPRIIRKSFYECMPTFNGDCDPIAALRWIIEIEYEFKGKCVDEDKSMYAVSKLRSNALIWWNMIKYTTMPADGSKMGWNHFKEVFKKKFCPMNLVMQLEDGNMSFKQGSQTVQEYNIRFGEMSRFIEDEHATMMRQIEMHVRAINGLDPNFCETVKNEKNEHMGWY